MAKQGFERSKSCWSIRKSFHSSLISHAILSFLMNLMPFFHFLWIRSHYFLMNIMSFFNFLWIWSHFLISYESYVILSFLMNLMSLFHFLWIFILLFLIASFLVQWRLFHCHWPIFSEISITNNFPMIFSRAYLRIPTRV